MKAVVAAFNQEKALVVAFSVIVQLQRLIVNTSIAGAILYIPFVYLGYVFKFMDKVTTFLQLMLQIAPPCGIADYD